jgi:hypothetical protein
MATPVGRALVTTGLGLSDLPPAVRAAFIDAGLPFLTIGLAVAVDLSPRWRAPLATVGGFLVFALSAGGAFALSSSTELARAIDERTALAGPIADSIGLAKGLPLLDPPDRAVAPSAPHPGSPLPDSARPPRP